MIGALPLLQPLSTVRVRRMAIVTWIVLNVVLVPLALAPWFTDLEAADWRHWVRLDEQLAAEALYEGSYRWSPLAAPVMVGVAAIGYPAWVLLHVAALPLLRDRMLIGLTLVSFGFWNDTVAGNAFTFVFIAAVSAYRGSRAAALVYLALLLLMPRPVQIPLAVWLLWQRPDVRWPFAGMVVAHGLAVIATGYTDDWLVKLASTAGDQAAMLPPANWAPTFINGSPLPWMLFAAPLAALLFATGRIGWASLLAAPYWLPYYFLMLLLELRVPQRRKADDRMGHERVVREAVTLGA